MKPSEFKESIKERLVLLKANTIFTAQQELAYARNNWTNVLSTIFFTFSVLIFVKVIYSNVQTIAGYTYNEMLLFIFVYQMTYYCNWIVTVRNLKDLIPDVNKGNLDMVLIKPVPSLYFLMTRTISLVSVTTGAIPALSAICFSINWSALNIIFTHLIMATAVWVLGLIALHTFQIISALPVFWFGESENILDLASATASASGTMIPLEGYNENLRNLLGTIIPVLIAGGFTTSILLGKSNPGVLFTWASIVGLISIYVRNLAWNFALKHYTSASS